MACDLATVQADLCDSGIGNETNPISLLQLSAQLSAEVLLAADPGADIALEAILDRACDSGIGKVTDPITLLQIIAQNNCQLANG